MPKRKEEPAPRGLLDAMDDLEDRRKKRRRAKKRSDDDTDELDLGRVW